jgi:hypothetical protein
VNPPCGIHIDALAVELSKPGRFPIGQAVTPDAPQIAQCSANRTEMVPIFIRKYAIISYRIELIYMPRRGGEMADTEDLKSSGAKAPCGFESRPRHHVSPTAMLLLWL